MKLTEKMSYLQGMLDGMEIDGSTKEGKALLQMSEVMAELVLYVEDLQSQVDELTELCDILDEDLGQVEEEIFDCDDCENCGECFDDDDFEDDEFDDDDFNLDDEGMIDEGSINCPNCNELLEFDYDDLTIEDFEETSSDED